MLPPFPAMKSFLSLSKASHISAMALPINTRPIGDSITLTPLDTVIKNKMDVGVIDVVSDQTGQALWTDDEGPVDSFVVNVVAGLASNTFGLYSALTGTQVNLITGVEGSQNFKFVDINGNSILDLRVGSGTVYADYTDFGNTFGFYFNSSFTEDSENGGTPLALSYALEDKDKFTYKDYGGATGTFVSDGDNDWLLAFEAGGSSAIDYADGVYIIEDAAPVPEPATMLLFGTGLAGLASLCRRKANKKLIG